MGTNGPSEASSSALFWEGELSMKAWHHIASATTTIAFSIGLFIASQLYVDSRLSAAEVSNLHAMKLRNVSYRVSYGR